MSRLQLGLVVLALLLAIAVPAEAQRRGSKIYGTWRSTSGARIVISDTGPGGFSISLTRTTGELLPMRGQWVHGLRGTQFQYWYSNQTYTGTFRPDDPDRVHVSSTDGTTSWWTREVVPVAAPAPTGGSVYGFWRSTSGNVFNVQGTGRGGFTLLMTAPNGAQQVLRGRWVHGLRGTQFQYWAQGAATANTGTFRPDDPNRIRVQTADGTVTWWTRGGGYAPAPVAMPPPPPAQPRVFCWAATDPGCRRTRDGRLPMDRAAFNSFLTLVSSARPHVFPMRDRVTTGVANQYLTSYQLTSLLEYFKPHVFPMLEVVKACAPHVVDPENGVGSVAAKFSPHTMVGTQASQVLSSQQVTP